MIDSKKLVHALRKFDDDRDWGQFHSPKNLAITIAVESGELLELFQWSRGQQSWQDTHAVDVREKIEQECADVLLNLIRFADKANIDLQAAAERKLMINAERYPVATSKGSDKKYNEKV